MATITSGSFDAANAGFLQLSSDTTRVYFDANLTIDAEGEPTGSTRTDFGGAFSDELPFTLITSALAISTTELNVMKNGTVISTNGAAGFGNTADYTFRVACNVDWDNMNFMCANGAVNGFGVAGSGATVRPVGRVVNSTFGNNADTGNWFVNLANVDASFVFANNALDSAVLNTAAAGNYVIGLAFAGTVRQQSNNNNSYTIRINSFARAYEGETNASPWTLMMNNSFVNNTTTPYAAGVGNDAIAHYETNNVPTGSTILMVNEQFEGDAFFAAKRNGTSATFISTYAWNPTFITPASATITDAKLVGVGSDVIYQVPTGATNRVSEFATQYPTISDGIIVNSSNGFLVQAGTLVISPNNATSLEGTAARAFADGSLLVTPVTKRAKSYTHLVDTVITSDINLIENSGGSTGSFSFTSEQATTADVDASLVSAPIATVIAYNGAVADQNSGSALYSRLKADWYSEDGLNESLADFAGTATAGTISSIHNINLSNTVASASVDATSGIVLPASAGITGDATYSAISTTGTISVGVPCTNMSLTGSTVTITAVAITGGTLSGLLDIVDGASFSGVTFDGTLHAFTGTSLDLSDVTLGTSFAATAGSGSGKTVTVAADTSAANQTILANAGWTVQLPPTLATLSIRPTRNGRYGVKRVYQGASVTDFIAPTDFVAGADLDIALTSADEWANGDYLEVWYKYDSDVAGSGADESFIYQEGTFRHNFTGASPANVTNGTVAFSVSITPVIVGGIAEPTTATFTTARLNDLGVASNTNLRITVSGASNTEGVAGSQGFAALVANTDNYFDTWFARGGTGDTLVDLGLGGDNSPAMNYDIGAITFASGENAPAAPLPLPGGGTATVQAPLVQNLTNLGTKVGTTGSRSLARGGTAEVANIPTGAASLLQVVEGARQGIDTSVTSSKVSDIENVAGYLVDDDSLGPLVNQYTQTTDYTGNI